jgi:hypothetical protein
MPEAAAAGDLQEIVDAADRIAGYTPVWTATLFWRGVTSLTPWR